MGEIKTIGVVGMGAMGRGIAQVAASVGFETLVYDISEKGLKEGHEFIVGQLDRGVQKGKWEDTFVQKTLSNIKIVDNLESLSPCDLIIEAVSEKKETKFTLFKKLDELMDGDCILASNTSSISITEIAAQTRRPHRVVGMHFMNPVSVMKLVEGIRGLETNGDIFKTVGETAKKMGKTFIEVKDTPGFAVNRILMPMINEAVYTLFEGVASLEDIDRSMTLGAHWPMGPLELADFIGLDTCLAIMEVLHEGLGDDKYRPCPLLRSHVLAGRLGKKSGRGFYRYGKDAQ